LICQLILADQWAAADGGSWAFEHEEGVHGEGCAIDLRSLNEEEAGASGWIRLSDDGNSFVRGDGEPIRFWAASTFAEHLDNDQRDQHARWLAKMGFNMARINIIRLPSKQPRSKVTDVDERWVERTWHLQAAMKKHGLYSVYVLHSAWNYDGADMSEWGIEGYSGRKGEEGASGGAPTGLLYFNPELQKGFKAQVKALLARENPYTGIPVAQDPSVPILLINSEDTLLFYTLNNIREPQMRVLGRRFGDWLTSKYGSLGKAVEAWDGDVAGDEAILADDLANGTVGIYNVWHLTREALGGRSLEPGRRQRFADQTEFLARLMHDFTLEMKRYLREELGCRQLIIAGNFYPADPVHMMDADRWSQTAGDIIGENQFFEGYRGGDAWSFLIREGDPFINRSVCNVFTGPTTPAEPGWSVPLAKKHVVGHPTFLTSSMWTEPSKWRGEAPFMVAAYGSLTGLDAYSWEGVGETPEYDERAAWNIDGSSSILVYRSQQPPIPQGFPAAALAFRKGYIREGDAVVHEERTLEALWDRRTALISENEVYARFNALRTDRGLDPKVFFVGPVEVVYGGDPSKTTTANLADYVNYEAQTLDSVTREIHLDYGKGYCAVDAAKCQGVSGFLASAGRVELSSIAVESTNEFASLLVVPLDDKPLSQSARVLVQVSTVALPTDWESVPAEFSFEGSGGNVKGERIVQIGRAPWQIANTEVAFSIENAGLSKAILLDSAGRPTRPVPTQREGSWLRLQLPPTATYVVLE
jgi:hypothetical protein